MSWFADLAGKAENLLTNLDQQTGTALRNQNMLNKKKPSETSRQENLNAQKKKNQRSLKTLQATKPFLTQSLPIHPKDPSYMPATAAKKSPKAKIPPNRASRGSAARPQDDSNSESYGYRPRRFTMPADLDDVKNQGWALKLESLDVENAILKNELNVTNREIKELVERLQATEEELTHTKAKLENIEPSYRKLNHEKNMLEKQVEQLKGQVSTTDLGKNKDQKRELQTEISVLRDRNKDLQELVRLYDEQIKEKCANHCKTENDLRHAQSTINVLQGDLMKTQEECKRLEKDWETYKHRVKTMLSTKDKEIKTLKLGASFEEDTKVLVEQIETMKKEREALSEAVNQVRGECGDMKMCMENLESRHYAAECVVVALRDALKHERDARTKFETSYNSIAKELKTFQIESAQTIANLRALVRDKDNELGIIRGNSNCSIKYSESSAINVADFDLNTNQHSEDSKKVYYLSDQLVQRQGKIDKLMADNNVLKIQLEKLESKFKNEATSTQQSHSVVSFQDGGGSKVRNSRYQVRGKLSSWFRVLVRAHPLFGMFVVIYMMCLHVWVFTVLLSNTPDTRGLPMGLKC